MSPVIFGEIIFLAAVGGPFHVFFQILIRYAKRALGLKGTESPMMSLFLLIPKAPTVAGALSSTQGKMAK